VTQNSRFDVTLRRTETTRCGSRTAWCVRLAARLAARADGVPENDWTLRLQPASAWISCRSARIKSACGLTVWRHVSRALGDGSTRWFGRAAATGSARAACGRRNVVLIRKLTSIYARCSSAAGERAGGGVCGMALFVAPGARRVGPPVARRGAALGAADSGAGQFAAPV